uniref:ARAD1B17666p n=1 Tax=Blastobotrys adeninivorans TaxID=409370 RepID=A0A060T6A5_BLAAD
MQSLNQSNASSKVDSSTSTPSAMLSPPQSPHPKVTNNASTISAIGPDTQSKVATSLPMRSPDTSPAIVHSSVAHTAQPSSSLSNSVGPSSSSLVDSGSRGLQPPHTPSALSTNKNSQTTSPRSSSKEVLNLQCYTLIRYDPNRPMVSSAWSSLVEDPVTYYYTQRQYLDLYPRHHGPTWANRARLFDRDGSTLNGTGADARPVRKRRRFNNVSDVDSSDGMVTRSRGGRGTPAILRTGAGSGGGGGGAGGASSRPSTPRPGRPFRAAGSPAAPPSKVHEMLPHQLTDYSPSPDTLPPGKSLKAEWKGAPMDLSQDPDAKYLHPAELHLASVLRLPAALYLDSKKRLFAEKVHRMRHNLPFRRTDSQKACRIDVNKASRLFSAFERVGWLDDKMFEKYL